MSEANKNTNDDEKIILAFDAYGTLLSTSSIAKKLSSHFGDEIADTIAATWRKYQLEYTWRANSMNHYESFSVLTLRSLKHALAESNVELKDESIADLMSSYDSLSTFADVAPALLAIKSDPGLRAVVFSNGTQSMVSASVHDSPDLSPYADVFEQIVTVEEVKRFKPAPGVYYHLARKLGREHPEREGGMDGIWLVSGNPFDVVGARAVGMKAVWVDREGKGWADGLVEGEVGRPSKIVRGLEEVVGVVRGEGAVR